MPISSLMRNNLRTLLGLMRLFFKEEEREFCGCLLEKDWRGRVRFWQT